MHPITRWTTEPRSGTHILGLRAFGSPLLTGQIIGRGLRRTNYDVLNQPLDERPEGYEETTDAFGIPFVGFNAEPVEPEGWVEADLAGGPGAGSLLQTLGAERSVSALFRIFSHCARTVRVFSGENSVSIA